MKFKEKPNSDAENISKIIEGESEICFIDAMHFTL